MKLAGLKTGIPAGYLLWEKVEVKMSDLRDCAVDVRIFPGQSQKLGIVERAGGFVGCKPDRETSWYDKIRKGHILDESAPLIRRPAVSGDSPARWYIEDGSGRAVAFLASQTLFDPGRALAIGYLGRQPDPSSSLMQKRFTELLHSN